MKAQRGSRGTALLCLNLGSRWGFVVSTMPRPLYPRERVLLCRRLGGPQGPVWTGAENLASTGIRPLDGTASSWCDHGLSKNMYHFYTLQKSPSVVAAVVQYLGQVFATDVSLVP